VCIRFQAAPMGEPNDILLHVNLMDTTADQQQESLGVLGVNLVYAAFWQRESRDTLLAGIFTGLTLRQFEVDVIEVRGPALSGLSNERCTLESLCRGMSHAVVFDGAGEVTEPSSVLRKRPLILERGHFPVVHPYHQKMLEAAQEYMRSENTATSLDPTSVVETTILDRGGARSASGDEILARVRRMQPLGPVIVSDLPQNYQLVDYLRRYTTEPIRFVVGVSTLAQMFGREHYEDLPGSLLEGLGKMLAENVRILAFPMLPADYLAALGAVAGNLEPLRPDIALVTADDIRLKPPINYLYQYIRAAGWIANLQAAPA
jgi:hypothetical protein